MSRGICVVVEGGYDGWRRRPPPPVVLQPQTSPTTFGREQSFGITVAVWSIWSPVIGCSAIGPLSGGVCVRRCVCPSVWSVGMRRGSQSASPTTPVVGA
eukprot:6675374-Lingulodinium_polyedra.AAC.1